MSGSSLSPFSPLGTNFASCVAELIPVFRAMLLMSYLTRDILKAMERIDIGQGVRKLIMLTIVLKLLQLRLHPQPVCLILKLSSVMEHLQSLPLCISYISNNRWRWVNMNGVEGRFGPKKKERVGTLHMHTHHAPFSSASSLLSNPRVDKGQVSFLHLWFLYLHLQKSFNHKLR